MSHPATNVARKPVEGVVRYAYRKGEAWRLARPRNTTISYQGLVKKKLAQENKELIALTKERHKRQFEEEYQLKKAEYEKHRREEAARKEQKRRASQRKQEYYENIMAEYRRLRDRRDVLNIQYNRKKDEFRAMARKEWLKVMNEDSDLWNKSPEDLRFRRYDIQNPQFYKKLPANHTYVLTL